MISRIDKRSNVRAFVVWDLNFWFCCMETTYTRDETGCTYLLINGAFVSMNGVICGCFRIWTNESRF